MKKLEYIAKQNLPGGVLKGDKIICNKNVYTLEKNGQQIHYNCIDEIAFFEKVKERIFNKNSFVYIKRNKQYKQQTRSEKYLISAHTELIVIDEFGNDVIVEIVLHGMKKQIVIPIKDVFKAEYWFFWNTDGVLSKELVGRFRAKEIFCESIGNYFKNNIDANRWVSLLRNTYTSQPEVLGNFTQR